MYILYKILNNLLSFIWSTNKNLPILKFNNIKIPPVKSFLFDLSDKTTHLGDKLFFIPLIRSLVLQNINVKIIDDGLTSLLYSRIFGENIPKSFDNEFINVFPRPSFLHLFNKYDNILLVDFTDKKTNDLISVEIIQSFNKLFNLNLSKIPNYSHKFHCYESDFEAQFVIFNNYVNSGFFRLFFINNIVLEERCEYLKKQGFKVIHVGSPADKYSDSRKYDFVDIDLRGQLPMNDLLDLLSSHNVHEIVTYDNFIMHMAHIFNKSTSVLFRGRFLVKNRLLHINYINNTFLCGKNKINYL